MKVLIVDDEEMIRGVLKEYVEFEGGIAYEAADGMQRTTSFCVSCAPRFNTACILAITSLGENGFVT